MCLSIALGEVPTPPASAVAQQPTPTVTGTFSGPPQAAQAIRPGLNTYGLDPASIPLLLTEYDVCGYGYADYRKRVATVFRLFQGYGSKGICWRDLGRLPCSDFPKQLTRNRFHAAKALDVSMYWVHCPLAVVSRIEYCNPRASLLTWS